MGVGSSRRSALGLVLTHALAFALPVVPMAVAIHFTRTSVAVMDAMFAEGYSRDVAGFDVLAGDDRAAAGGLQRHLDRVTVVRRQLVAGGGGAVDVRLLDINECTVLAEIAFLSEAPERDARVADTVASCQRNRRASACPDAGISPVLGIGATWVKRERGAE